MPISFPHFFPRSFFLALLFVASLFGGVFIAPKDSVLANDKLWPPRRLPASKPIVMEQNRSAKAGRARCGAIYRVRRGDTVLKIARKCRVSVWRIRSLNHLKSGRLRPGQVLRLRPLSTKSRKKITPQSPALIRRLLLPTPQYGTGR